LDADRWRNAVSRLVRIYADRDGESHVEEL